ncbi:nitrous oxide reductase family maturation protein NosD [Natrialbaceae archaeon GCM10025810]|uniref:nitrous oxide reductase family maturation protein NosD n=1 Tax=Halovalidus salilacus TaxID=3075124 RepID=UPI00360A1AD8
MTLPERYFAIAAAAILVASLLGAVVAASSGADDTESVDGWRADVPDPEAADEPSSDGVATVDGREFDSVQAAVDAADPGDEIRLEGRFDERVTVDTPGVTLEARERDGALIDGGGEGTVIEVAADDVTVEGVWVRNSGPERGEEDSGIYVNGSDATVSSLRATDVTFGVYLRGAEATTVEDSLVAGRSDLDQDERGNGIHLWEANETRLENNSIRTVRDGIYYQWAKNVVAEGNAMWEMRYGVHYMYSESNHLEDNVAFDNDIGYALMVSSDISMVNNTAANNDGPSGHGIQLKDIEDSEIVGNDVVGNGNGLYVYNAQDNRLADNLVLENDVGVHVTAGSESEVVSGNSFVGNDEAAFAETNSQAHWNESDRGNYWSDASAADLDGDGVSEARHQPAGSVERLVRDEPRAAVFAESPAFDAVRLAESSFPVLESPGIVDNHPLAESPHDHWRSYYDDEHHDH